MLPKGPGTRLVAGYERLGKPRVVAVLTAVLLVLAGATGGLFLYHPAPDEETRPAFYGELLEPYPPPSDGAYRLHTEVHLRDGTDASHIEATTIFAPGDPAVEVTTRRSMGVETGELYEFVRYRRGTEMYVRETDDDALREQGDAEDGEIYNNATNVLYRVYPDRSPPTAHPPMRDVSFIMYLPYERDGTRTVNGRDVVRYVPQTGWHNPAFTLPGRPLYVKSASGEVLVDEETGAIVGANVTAAAVQAKTWADVLRKEAVTVTAIVSTTSEVDRPTPPPWVQHLRNTSAARRKADN